MILLLQRQEKQTALSGNNLAGALASGASPYLATEIKKLTTVNGEVNIAANALAHTILGAVTAELNNQSAVAGGLGAGGGELAARVIASNLYPNKAISELTESEKQQVSALSQLAGGISTSNGVFLNKKFIPAQPTRVPFHSLTQNGVYLPARNLFTVINNERNRKNTN